MIAVLLRHVMAFKHLGRLPNRCIGVPVTRNALPNHAMGVPDAGK